MKLTDRIEPTTEELDVMLCALRDASPIDPPDEIRDGLFKMAASDERTPNQSKWLRWAIPSSACAAVLLLSAGLHYFATSQKRPLPLAIRTDQAPHGLVDQVVRHDTDRRPVAVRRRAIATKAGRIHPPLSRENAPQSAGVDLELPYSNRTIVNGTSAIVQVAISREELAALGIPINSVAGESRYIADIALGDDGLPRSIHVPLPLRSIN
jgi:hypothetical protein